MSEKTMTDEEIGQVEKAAESIEAPLLKSFLVRLCAQAKEANALRERLAAYEILDALQKGDGNG